MIDLIDISSYNLLLWHAAEGSLTNIQDSDRPAARWETSIAQDVQSKPLSWQRACVFGQKKGAYTGIYLPEQNKFARSKYSNLR